MKKAGVIERRPDMNQRYESRKEYSLMDVLQYNLRKWWLAAVFAAVFAVIVGGIQGKNPDALY